MCHQPEISLGNFTFSDILFKKHSACGGCRASLNFSGNVIDLWVAAEPKGREMTGCHTSGKTLHKALFGILGPGLGDNTAKTPATSRWQEPISAAKKLFPTASVLLVNVCVCVGCRREPGKTSWALDQKMGIFFIVIGQKQREQRGNSMTFAHQVKTPNANVFCCTAKTGKLC